MKRIRREYYGEIQRIPPRAGGALAHCRFCDAAFFVEDRKRKKWNSVDRATAALRFHVGKHHKDKMPTTGGPVDF